MPSHLWASSLCSASARRTFPRATKSGTSDRGSMATFVLRLARNQDGSVLVETTVMMILILMFVLGGIDFLFAFYQWNAASKAVQWGARIAAVSDPVAPGLGSLSLAVSGTPG